jgi:hypothetical protein
MSSNSSKQYAVQCVYNGIGRGRVYVSSDITTLGGLIELARVSMTCDLLQQNEEKKCVQNEKQSCSFWTRDTETTPWTRVWSANANETAAYTMTLQQHGISVMTRLMFRSGVFS